MAKSAADIDQNPEIEETGPSWVLYEPARTRHAGETFLSRYADLVGAAGVERLARRDEEVLIRVDVGELGAFRGIRPAFIRAIVEKVRQSGRHPVLFDTTHVRQGGQGLGWSLVDAATINGLVSSALGTEVNVGDGWGGGETELLAVEGEELGGIEVARVVVDGGGVIVVSHVTGHPLTGLSGALMALGEGCLGRTGKVRLAKGLHPQVGDGCDGCGACVDACPEGALRLDGPRAVLDVAHCKGCSLICSPTCPVAALALDRADRERYARRVVESSGTVAMAAMGKLLFVSLLLDVTAEPETVGYSDLPFVPDLGVLISSDPVALDTAALDLIDMAPGIPGTAAQTAGILSPGMEKLERLCGNDPRTMVAMAEEFGLGTRAYRLVSL